MARQHFSDPSQPQDCGLGRQPERQQNHGPVAAAGSWWLEPLPDCLVASQPFSSTCQLSSTSLLREAAARQCQSSTAE